MRMKFNMTDFKGKTIKIEKEIPAKDHLAAQIKYKSQVFKNKKKQLPRKAKYKNLPYDTAPLSSLYVAVL